MVHEVVLSGAGTDAAKLQTAVRVAAQTGNDIIVILTESCSEEAFRSYLEPAYAELQWHPERRVPKMAVERMPAHSLSR